jgi:hypothetical protein
MLARLARIGLRTFGVLFGISLVMVMHLVVLFMLLHAFLRHPAVQQRAVPAIEFALSEVLQTRVQLGGIELRLFDKIALRQLHIYDQRGGLMIQAGELQVGLLSLNLLKMVLQPEAEMYIGARALLLDDAAFHLVRYPDSTWNIDFLTQSESPPDSTPTPLSLDFPTVEITRLDFSLVDSTLADSLLRPTPGVLNYQNMYVEDIHLYTSFELICTAGLLANIDTLRARERHSGLVLQQLKGNFSGLIADNETVARQLATAFVPNGPDDRAPQAVRLFNARLAVNGTSRLDFDLMADGFRLDNIGSLATDRHYILNLRPSNLRLQDIDYFMLGDTLPARGQIQLEGFARSNTWDGSLRQLRVAFGGSQLHLDARARNFRDLDRLFLDAKVHRGVINPDDLTQLMPSLELPDEVPRLGVTQLFATLVGTLRDFSAQADVRTDIGTAQCDIQYHINAQREFSFEGGLATQSLNIDSLLAIKVSHQVNFTGQVDGHGVLVKDGKKTRTQIDSLHADFSCYSSFLLDNELDSVSGDLSFMNKHLVGNLYLNDSIGTFHGNIDIFFRDTLPEYQFIGDIKHLKLHMLDTSMAYTNIDAIAKVNVRGDSLDNMTGRIRLDRIHLSDSVGHELDIRDFQVTLDSLGNQKVLEARLRNQAAQEALKLKLSGAFEYSYAIKVITQLVGEMDLFFKADSVLSAKYYKKKLLDTIPYKPINLRYDLAIGDITSILDFFDIPIVLRKASSTGIFTLGLNEKALISYEADSISYGNMALYNPSGKLFITKELFTPEFISNASLNCERLKASSSLTLQNFDVSANWKGDEILYELHTRQEEFKTYVDLVGATLFSNDIIYNQLDSARSRLVLGGKTWSISESNRVALVSKPKRLEVDGLTFRAGDQQIRINGQDNLPKTTKGLYLDVRNFNLRSLDAFLPPESYLGGTVTATANVYDLFTNPVIVFNGNINQFAIGKAEYGDFYAKSNYAPAEAQVNLNFGIVLEGDTLLGMRGFIKPKGSQIDFKPYKPIDIPLTYFAAITHGILFDLGGRIYAGPEDIRIQGSLSDPDIRGSIQLRKARIGVEYFKTRFFVDDRIYFDEKVISVKKLKLLDDNNNEKNFALVNGSIRHQGFQNLYFNLRIEEVRNFLMMNTTSRDNELFYGRAIIQDGIGTIRGPAGGLRLELDVSTGKGTTLNIPVADFESGQTLSYVYFKTQPTDTLDLSKLKDESLGFELSLTMRITRDAQVGIIFDPQVGDEIRGSGIGTLTLGLSMAGEFTMNGDFTLYDGNYLFTFRNIFAKYFVLEPGGRIVWTGDPLNARLENLRAVYRASADLNQLLPNFGGDSTQASNRVNVQVVMGMSGSLFSPVIKFELVVPELNADNAFLINSMLKMIEADEQELNRQVFSLLLFQRFFPVSDVVASGSGNPAGAAAAGGLSSSVGEFLSSQFNYWLGQVIGDDNVGVTLRTENVDVMYLQLQARLFNDRVTVRRDGILVGGAQRDISVGNVSVEIRVLPLKTSDAVAGTGRMNFEIFNRENIGFGNQITAINRGVGLYYQKDFNRLPELLIPNNQVREVPYIPLPEAPPIPPPINLLGVPAGPSPDPMYPEFIEFETE